MKIYTKVGDKGSTNLGDGSTVQKTNLRLEAFGTVDELNAHIGLLRDMISSKKEFLLQIQKYLFEIGAYYANPSGNIDDKKLNHKVVELEAEIDSMNDGLPELRNFIVPGGHPTISQAHICRTVTRRAERKTIALFEEINSMQYFLMAYMNRLSDYFFVLARYIANENGIKETIWTPDNEGS